MYLIFKPKKQIKSEKNWSAALRFSGVLSGKCSVKRTIRLVMGFNTMFTQHNFYAAQVHCGILLTARFSLQISLYLLVKQKGDFEVP